MKHSQNERPPARWAKYLPPVRLLLIAGLIACPGGLGAAEDDPVGNGDGVLSNRLSRKLPLPIPEPLLDGEHSGSEDAIDLDGKTFQQLDESREPRKLLIDYLLEAGKIRESPKGTLDFLEHIAPIGIRAVREENRTRMKMFSLIAERENRAIAAVGREFHQKQTATSGQPEKAEKPAPEIDPSLIIRAPKSIRDRFLSKLVTSYLNSLGYSEVMAELRGDTVRMIGRRSFGHGFTAIDIETEEPGSSRKRGETVYFEVGRPGNGLPSKTIALEGLTVVVHRDNPVDSLTVSQLADIFSGKTRNWDDVRGGDDREISVHLPKSTALDLFWDLVLKPEGEELDEGIDRVFDKSGDLLARLSGDPGGIGFCRFGENLDEVKVLRIKASSEAVAVYPSSIHIKSLEYPLTRYIGVSAISYNSFVEDFLSFTDGEVAQRTVQGAGFFGIGLVPGGDRSEALRHRELLLDDPDVPESYKNLIRRADRFLSPFTLRFVPGGDDFQLTANSTANLEGLVKKLADLEDRNLRVILIGFADDNGSSSANRIYSKKRADSIEEKLREEGITRIETAGMGEEMPVADNDEEAGRAANRRVEVWIER